MSENVSRLQRQEPTFINIVGFIKVNETLPERIVQLITCIRSFDCLKEFGRFILCLDRPSEWLYQLVDEELRASKWCYELSRTFEDDARQSYGNRYAEMLELCQTEYVLNFMEDQFLLCNAMQLTKMLNAMSMQNCEIMKATFFEVEHQSIQLLTDKVEDEYGYYYTNDKEHHDELQKLWHRYFVGVNFITTLDFAKRFWGRFPDTEDTFIMNRPHEYEMAYYNDKWKHRVMVPKIEVMAAVDDDHGVENSCLVKRKPLIVNAPKFHNIIGVVQASSRYVKPKQSIPLFYINNYNIKTEKLGNHLHGSIVRVFEQNFCRYVGAKYGCSLNSATSAIFLIFENGEDVMLPSLIPPVVPNAIINAGGNVVFVDNVDWVGWSYHMQIIQNEQYRIIDSAQRVDRNQYFDEAMSEDEIMIFSHYPTKPVAGMDGAMIVSNNRDHIEYYRAMSLNGMSFAENNWDRNQEYIGHKMYMNASQAYVANENLKLLDAKKKVLARIRKQYDEAFEIPDSVSDHLYVMAAKDRPTFMQKMFEAGFHSPL